MKIRIALMLLFAMLMLQVSAHASSYLYFTGWLDAEGKMNSEPEQVNVWDFSSDSYQCLGIEGYLIGKGSADVGCYVALDKLGSLKYEIELAYCADGRVQETRNVSLPDKVVRIYAMIGDWIYYGYQNSEEDYGIRRVDAEGNIESYAVGSLITSAAHLKELPCAVSDGGWLAFNAYVSAEEMFSPVHLCVARPNEAPFAIVQSESYGNRGCSWLGEEKLIFTDENAQVFMYDAQTNRISALSTQLILGSLPQTNICTDAEQELLAYQEYNPEKLFGLLPAIDDSWNPLVMVSMADGQQRVSKRVCINTYGTGSFSLQMQFE